MRPLFSLTALLLGLVMAAPLAHAHGSKPGHSQKAVTEAQAVEAAKKAVATMVKEKAVEESWTAAEVASAAKKASADGSEWVVAFKNSKAADAAKGTLYVFLSLTGDYVAANYTGR